MEEIREVLAEAQKLGIPAASTAMQELIRLNTLLLELEEEIAVLKGAVAHG